MINEYKPIKWDKRGVHNWSMSIVCVLGVTQSVLVKNANLGAAYELNIPNGSGLGGPEIIPYS